MGQPGIDEVIQALREAGFRAARAYPGERMPHIQVSAVAVALHEKLAGQQTLAVTVLCPECMGGDACEDEAQQAAELLRNMGAECIQEHCQYDGKGDRFSVRLLATWQEETAECPYTVTMAGGLMPYVTAFTAEQKVDIKTIGAMGQGEPVGVLHTENPWVVTLEEQIPRDTQEPIPPEEPFDFLVRRGTVGEHYQGCYWTSHFRQDTAQGLRQIRTGIAMLRSIIAYE